MKIKFNIPESLEDITVHQLKEFHSIQEDDEHAAVLAIAILCKITPQEAINLPVEIANEIFETITKGVNQKPDLQRTFELDGVKYGLIPNFEKMSFGEYIDMDTYFKIKDGVFDYTNAERLMAVAYRPIIDGYKTDLYRVVEYEGTEGRDKAMLKAPASVLQGLLVFFCDLSNELLTDSQEYIQEVETLLMRENSTVKSGDGMEVLTALQKETLRNSTALQNYPYQKLSRLSNTWPMKNAS